MKNLIIVSFVVSLLFGCKSKNDEPKPVSPPVEKEQETEGPKFECTCEEQPDGSTICTMREV